MYHITITDKKTGVVKLDEDISALVSSFCNEKGGFSSLVLMRDNLRNCAMTIRAVEETCRSAMNRDPEILLAHDLVSAFFSAEVIEKAEGKK